MMEVRMGMWMDGFGDGALKGTRDKQTSDRLFFSQEKKKEKKKNTRQSHECCFGFVWLNSSLLFKTATTHLSPFMPQPQRTTNQEQRTPTTQP
jgi:hypothetical protein